MLGIQFTSNESGSIVHPAAISTSYLGKTSEKRVPKTSQMRKSGPLGFSTIELSYVFFDKTKAFLQQPSMLEKYVFSSASRISCSGVASHVSGASKKSGVAAKKWSARFSKQKVPPPLYF